MITLTNVSKKYGEHVIFDQYNLTINDGEFVAITGASGKGKTTLLNMIGLLDKHDAGDIVIQNHKNPKFSSRSGMALLRKDLSFVFQNFGLVESETVLYNMKVATRFLRLNSKDERQVIADALEQVGLPAIEKMKVYQLSGGEQQRVALARILIKPSTIILADEPTGSLDKENRDQVLALLKKFNDDGKTVVVVTHDPAVEQCASRVVRL